MWNLLGEGHFKIVNKKIEEMGSGRRSRRLFFSFI